MEKFMHRENVLVEYAESSSKSPYRSSEETDFKDVFGGPPRRFSMQEVRVRYSFSETVESEEEKATSPWIVLKEKPVFGGEETGSRRRHQQGNDFYDDIFGGDESYSSPRKSDHRDRDNSFGSIPGSSIMSPARSLPPKSELFGTSLPAQFSLPSKSTKPMELPTFGSKSPLSPSSSRFSHEAIRRSLDETRNENHPVFRPSPLSHHEAPLSSEDLPSNFTFDQKGNVEKLKKETENVDYSNDNEFHFSIYKWAGLGIPMLLPLLGRNNVKSKDISRNNIEPHSLKIECEEINLRINEEEKEKQNYTESKTESKEKNAVGFVGDGGIDVNEETEKEISTRIKESLKSKLKPLHGFLDDEVELRGRIKDTKEKKIRTPTGAQSYKHAKKNVKKNEGTRIDSNRETADKSKISEVTSKSGVKGKVRNFVHIFSQEAESERKADVISHSHSFRMKSVGIEKKENEASLNASKSEENVNFPKVDRKPEVSPKVNENLNKDEVHQYSFTKTDDFSSNQDNAFSSESLNRDSKISSEYSDDAFEDTFEVEELSEDPGKPTQSVEGSEDFKALDVKIQQWSFGKKGNIRSLLSTLQFVLWPESGWTPVPLMDLIEGNTVKRAYQKALLRLHPDKLQQKGAPSSHKYIAEKVFDILQEAWDHFNTLAPL